MRRRGRRAFPRAEFASEKQSRKARQLMTLSRQLRALVELSSDAASPFMATRPGDGARVGGVGGGCGVRVGGGGVGVGAGGAWGARR